ncbi:DUF465 domain-containing protein [soil metagenome]
MDADGTGMNDDEPPEGLSAAEAHDLRRRLATLKIEHKDLDASVEALAVQPRPDMLQIARLKKRKLALRDEIARMQDQLTPDIMA